MNLVEFTSLLKDPGHVSEEQTHAVEEILENYPYFQAARIVHLKGLKDQSSFKYNSTLKVAAAYTTNRTVLFDFITADSLNVDERNKEEKEIIKNSEIIDLEVVDNTSEERVSTAIQDEKDDVVKAVEEKLEIGKPLVFDISEMHSFYEWLQLTSATPIERATSKEVKSSFEKEEKFDLIEQFIQSKPKINPASTEENTDISVESATENESLMTETLARVYLEQKKYDKAIQAFKILSLKYPEKSSFFADRIKAIKFLQKNNT